MDYKGMTYPEAITHLANLYNIPVEHDAKAQTAEEVDHLTQLDRTLRAAHNQYQKALHEALPDSVPVLELYRNRGLVKDTVLQWQLGWAPDEWRYLTDKVLPVGLFEIARELGLCNHKNGNNYDVYRGRIIFPIHDQADRLIGFGGRDVTGKEGIPKYLNSPETRLYHKERVLYGLNHAAQHIRTGGFAVVVEGYFDVISLHQAGCPQAVATCGTALTDAHLTILKRYTNHLVFGFDGDAAGQKALYKAVASAVKFGFKVDALVLPAAEDPDSLARNWVKEHKTEGVDEIEEVAISE
jgi:DNA primase